VRVGEVLLGQLGGGLERESLAPTLTRNREAGLGGGARVASNPRGDGAGEQRLL
jgi:hypothetical protein